MSSQTTKLYISQNQYTLDIHRHIEIILKKICPRFYPDTHTQYKSSIEKSSQKQKKKNQDHSNTHPLCPSEPDSQALYTAKSVIHNVPGRPQSVSQSVAYFNTLTRGSLGTRPLAHRRHRAGKAGQLTVRPPPPQQPFSHSRLALLYTYIYIYCQ